MASATRTSARTAGRRAKPIPTTAATANGADAPTRPGRPETTASRQPAPARAAYSEARANGGPGGSLTPGPARAAGPGARPRPEWAPVRDTRPRCPDPARPAPTGRAAATTDDPGLRRPWPSRHRG